MLYNFVNPSNFTYSFGQVILMVLKILSYIAFFTTVFETRFISEYLFIYVKKYNVERGFTVFILTRLIYQYYTIHYNV